MKVSIIIPVFNEKKTILEIINRVKEVKINLEKEIIVVDDGSTDGTTELLKGLNDRIKVILKDKNEGKGSAVITGIKNSSGDIIIIQDADLEYSPEDYPKLIEPILRGEVKVVYGSRILGNPSVLPSTLSGWYFYLGGRLVSIFTNILYKSNITDEPTCYKVFHRSILDSLNLESKGFEICPEITAKVLKLGYKIYEVPIKYSPRTPKEGKKIKFRDGIIALWTLLKYRFKKIG